MVEVAQVEDILALLARVELATLEAVAPLRSSWALGALVDRGPLLLLVQGAWRGP